MFVEWVVKGKPSLLGIVSGAVAGLVAVTPAAGFCRPDGRDRAGPRRRRRLLLLLHAVKNTLGYDDSLDVFGVHCIGGIIGAIGTGILVNPALGGAGIMDYTTGKIAEYDLVAQMISQTKAVLPPSCGRASDRSCSVIDMHRRSAREGRERARRPRHHRARRTRLQYVSLRSRGGAYTRHRPSPNGGPVASRGLFRFVFMPRTRCSASGLKTPMVNRTLTSPP